MSDRQRTVAAAGMTISVRTRRDAVVTDPDRFMATARQAYRDLNPTTTPDEAREAVADVYDATHILLQRFGQLASTDPAVAGTAAAADQQQMRPGQRVEGRPDGLSPAGLITAVNVEEPMPLQDYGCFLPDDVFTERRNRDA